MPQWDCVNVDIRIILCGALYLWQLDQRERPNTLNSHFSLKNSVSMVEEKISKHTNVHFSHFDFQLSLWHCVYSVPFLCFASISLTYILNIFYCSANRFSHWVYFPLCMQRDNDYNILLYGFATVPTLFVLLLLFLLVSFSSLLSLLNPLWYSIALRGFLSSDRAIGFSLQRKNYKKNCATQCIGKQIVAVRVSMVEAEGRLNRNIGLEWGFTISCDIWLQLCHFNLSTVNILRAFA